MGSGFWVWGVSGCLGLRFPGSTLEGLGQAESSCLSFGFRVLRFSSFGFNARVLPLHSRVFQLRVCGQLLRSCKTLHKDRGTE